MIQRAMTDINRSWVFKLRQKISFWRRFILLFLGEKLVNHISIDLSCEFLAIIRVYFNRSFTNYCLLILIKLCYQFGFKNSVNSPSFLGIIFQKIFNQLNYLWFVFKTPKIVFLWLFFRFQLRNYKLDLLYFHFFFVLLGRLPFKLKHLIYLIQRVITWKERIPRE